MEKETLSNPILWSPSNERVKSSQMFRFLQNINAKYDLNLDSFSELHNWSIENKSEFWSSIWDFFKIIGSKGKEPYIEPANKMPRSKFFPNGSVNYAENMLSGNISGPAIIFKSEDKIRKEVSWKDLKSQVASLANFLKKEGLNHNGKPGKTFGLFLGIVAGCRWVGECLIACCRNVVPGHELLGEIFRGFKLRGRLAWTEDLQPLGLKPVNKPSRKGCLGPHHGKGNLVVL